MSGGRGERSERSEKERSKQVQERCQRILGELLKDDDNKYCVDCDAKGPRWASWNLGIFLCIRCAGIHRNLGVHISKVKSVNLDSWTPSQVVTLQQMGNSRARAVYEANLPDAFRRPQTDSALEAFVRAKYEHKKYIAREWVPPDPPNVDWDREIDLEMDKQKRKKKPTTAPTTTTPSTNTPSVLPKLLPKPKSSVSPKPTKRRDLLDRSSDDAAFSDFLSAPQEKPAEPEPQPLDLKSEEENFFNQPTPSEKDKSKMTKDSIMALYGQAPLKNVPNPAFQPFAHAGPAFNQTHYAPNGAVQPQSFPGFAQVPQGAFGAQYASLQSFNPTRPDANGTQGFVAQQTGLSQHFAGLALNQSANATAPAQQNVTGNFSSNVMQSNSIWQ